MRRAFKRTFSTVFLFFAECTANFYFLRTFNICLFEAAVIHCVPARDNIERLSTTYLSFNEGLDSIFVVQLSYRRNVLFI